MQPTKVTKTTHRRRNWGMGTASLTIVLGLSLTAAARSLTYDVKHDVLPGETLGEIARYYAVPVDAVKRLNKLKSTSVKEGQTLSIKTSKRVYGRQKGTYTLRKGDSLSTVAKKFGMSLALLKKLNPSQTDVKLRPGRTLAVVRDVASATKPETEGAKTRVATDNGPNTKRLYQLTGGPGVKVRHPERSWGTFLTVTRLQDVFADYALKYPKAPTLFVYDISVAKGGKLKPHRSHQTGRDVDIGYVLKNGGETRDDVEPSQLDLEKNWQLVQLLLKSGDVTYIFMDYKIQKALFTYAKKRGQNEAWLKQIFELRPNGGSMTGIVRHASGHKSHLHVRFNRDATSPFNDV